MNYSSLNISDVSNGEGVRVTLFVSGCNLKCKGCFNSAAWDFNYGNLYTSETESEILEALSKPYIKGFSLLGGEPYNQDVEVLAGLLEKVKAQFPNKDIWI